MCEWCPAYRWRESLSGFPRELREPVVLMLKKQGYNLEHNFGHGDKNPSNLLVTLNLIAFLCHTILAMTSEAYQKIRKKLGARKKFFEHIRTLTH